LKCDYLEEKLKILRTNEIQFHEIKNTYTDYFVKYTATFSLKAFEIKLEKRIRSEYSRCENFSSLMTTIFVSDLTSTGKKHILGPNLFVLKEYNDNQ